MTHNSLPSLAKTDFNSDESTGLFRLLIVSLISLTSFFGEVQSSETAIILPAPTSIPLSPDDSLLIAQDVLLNEIARPTSYGVLWNPSIPANNVDYATHQVGGVKYRWRTAHARLVRSIATITPTAKGGDTIRITGSNLDLKRLFLVNKDNLYIYDVDAGSSSSTKISYPKPSDKSVVAVELPSENEFDFDRPFFVIPEVKSGNSTAIHACVGVNLPKARWIGPKRTSPGHEVIIHGRNLISPRPGSQPIIRVRSITTNSNNKSITGSWQTIPANIDNVEPLNWENCHELSKYALRFDAPTVPGNYEVWVHNGARDDSGARDAFAWSGPLSLQVEPPNSSFINAESSDPTAGTITVTKKNAKAIQDALDLNSSGNSKLRVILTPGHYIIDRQLHIPSNTSLEGTIGPDGKKTELVIQIQDTGLLYAIGFGMLDQGSPQQFVENAAIMNLNISVQAGNHFKLGVIAARNIWIKSIENFTEGSRLWKDILIDNVSVSLKDRFQKTGAVFCAGIDSLHIRNSQFEGSRGTVVEFSRQVFIQNNIYKGLAQRPDQWIGYNGFRVNGCLDVDVSRNHVTGVFNEDKNRRQSAANRAFVAHSYATQFNVSIFDNKTTDVKPIITNFNIKGPRGANSGETILLEGGADPYTGGEIPTATKRMPIDVTDWESAPHASWNGVNTIHDAFAIVLDKTTIRVYGSETKKIGSSYLQRSSSPHDIAFERLFKLHNSTVDVFLDTDTGSEFFSFRVNSSSNNPLRVYGRTDKYADNQIEYVAKEKFSTGGSSARRDSTGRPPASGESGFKTDHYFLPRRNPPTKASREYIVANDEVKRDYVDLTLEPEAGVGNNSSSNIDLTKLEPKSVRFKTKNPLPNSLHQVFSYKPNSNQLILPVDNISLREDQIFSYRTGDRLGIIVQIVKGPGTGQMRTIRRVTRNGDSSVVLSLDRPFDLAPISGDSVVNVARPNAQFIIHNNEITTTKAVGYDDKPIEEDSTTAGSNEPANANTNILGDQLLREGGYDSNSAGVVVYGSSNDVVISANYIRGTSSGIVVNPIVNDQAFAHSIFIDGNQIDKVMDGITIKSSFNSQSRLPDTLLNPLLRQNTSMVSQIDIRNNTINDALNYDLVLSDDNGYKGARTNKVISPLLKDFGPYTRGVLLDYTNMPDGGTTGKGNLSIYIDSGNETHFGSDFYNLTETSSTSE